MSVFDDIRKSITPKQTPAFEGYIWVNILIKYGADGKAEIVRSFSKPAKDSVVKSITKPKKFVAPKIEIEKSEEKKELF